MVKIGEVEFLIKFDTIGKQFKDVVADVLEDMDIGGEDLDDRLATIEGHLGLLVTPFSGNRMIDLVKSKGYLQQLKDEDWIKGKVEAIAANQTLLTKLGLEEMELGAKDTQDAVSEQFEFLTKNIADFVKVTLSSEFAYMRNFATLQDIISLLTASTEGNLAYLMEKIIDKVKGETSVTKAIYEWLKDDMGAKIEQTERWWHEILQDAKSESETQVVETYQDFLDLLGEKFKDDPDKEKIIERILFKDPQALTGVYREKVEDAIKDVTFKAGLKIPKNLADLIKELRGAEISTGYIKLDLKAIVEDITKVEDVVSKMGGGLSKEEREALITRAEEFIDKFGWYFFFGEAKVFGSLRKLEKEKTRLGPGMPEEMLTGGFMGTQFSSFAEEISSKIAPIAEIAADMNRELPKKIVDGLQKEFETLASMEKYMKGIPDSVVKGFRDQYDDIMKNLSRIYDG